MAGDHFFIQSTRITALSRDFTHASSDLGTEIDGFATSAENVNDAFGVLSESTEALTKYVEMTQATVTSLRQLQQHLEKYSEGLKQTVTNYQAGDQAQAQSFGGA